MSAVRYRFATRQQARDYLNARYVEQLQMFPRLARIPQTLYVRRNLTAAMWVTVDEES